MYEEFLEKSLNNKRQAVDDTFIAKYADLSYPELNTLWQEVGVAISATELNFTNAGTKIKRA